MLPIGADMASFAQVNAFVDAFLAHPLATKLTTLILNAGIGAPQAGAPLSGDGFEIVVQSNYLSGVLIMKRLLPLLRAHNGTVVNVASLAHAGASSQPAKNLAFTETGGDLYGRSKVRIGTFYCYLCPFADRMRVWPMQLLQIAASVAYAKSEGTAVRIVSVHPGACHTDMPIFGVKQGVCMCV